MSDSLNQALIAVVAASFGVISYRVIRRLIRAQGSFEREVAPQAFVPPLHDREAPIAKAKEHPTVAQSAAADRESPAVKGKPLQE